MFWGAKQAGAQALLFDRKVPEEFLKDSHSLHALTRTHTGELSQEPDGRLVSLHEILRYLENRFRAAKTQCSRSFRIVSSLSRTILETPRDKSHTRTR